MSTDPTAGAAQKPKSRLALLVVIFGGLLLLLVGGGLAAFMFWAVNSARETGRSNACHNNMSNIALALLQYENRHGKFPPAVTYGRDGKPMHSWRVMILPYLDRNDLYRAYNFDQPWDSPDNQKLAGLMPDVFRCPSSAKDDDTTDYVVVVGDNTPMQDGDSLSAQHLQENDGMSTTLLIIEAKDSNINWLEPRDLDFDEVVKTYPNGPAGSPHPGGMNVSFCDRYVTFLSSDTPPETFKALLTGDGREVVDESMY